MPRVSGLLTNLVGGVSQQAPALRGPTQFERVDNWYPTILKGLRRRPRTSLVKVLGSVSAIKWHFIDRDSAEQYAVAISATGIRVFSLLDGSEKTVNAPQGWGYLAGGAQSEDYQAVTVADYTYIVNSQKVVTLDPASALPTRPHEALINIQAGNYARTYQIRINGDVVAEYATPDGSSNSHYPQIATTEIAKRLHEDLLLNLGNDGDPWGIGIHQNALHIINHDEDFSIAGEDGTNGNAMKIAKGRMDKFSDLPNYGADGFVIEVANSPGTQFDNMWVRADKGGTNNNSVVSWKEIPKPGVPRSFVAGTMPHLLKREPDGTFTFFPAEWDSMKCGDGENTSPPPSFVGQKIRGILFHRNRFGVLADENVILSRAGSFFDFWRTTTSALLDDDPIDVSAAHSKVSFMNHSVPFKDTLILFSENTQFRLAGNDLLTPKSVSIRPLTEHACSPKVDPVSLGRSIFFLSDTDEPGGFCSVTEWAYEAKTDRAEDAEVTAHVPALIPRGAKQLVGSIEEGMLFAMSTTEPKTIFTYRYYWNADEKVQSSWVRWTFQDEVAGMFVIDSILYIVFNKAGTMRLERVNLDTAATDPYLPFAFCLDSAQVLTSTAQFPTATTTRLPALGFDHTDLRAVVFSGPPGTVGQRVKIVAKTNSYVDVEGQWASGVKILFGVPYESWLEFSQFYHRDNNGMIMSAGRLQLISLELVFDTSSVFDTFVTNGVRETVQETYNGSYINQNGIVGQPQRGRYAMTVLGRADDAKIEIKTSSHMPAAFVSASWKGTWTPYLREV